MTRETETELAEQEDRPRTREETETELAALRAITLQTPRGREFERRAQAALDAHRRGGPHALVYLGVASQAVEIALSEAQFARLDAERDALPNGQGANTTGRR